MIKKVMDKRENIVVLENFINIIKLGRLIGHGTILVYVLGVLFALLVGGSFDLVKFIVGYVILFSGILAAIYTNNYNDVATDRNAVHTFFSGGSSILIEHPELMKTTRYVFIGLYLTSILLGLVFTVVFSYPATFFVYILLGNLLGWCYTSPPIKLVYRGFGELATMVGAGFIIPGFAYFLVRGTIDVAFVLFSIPLMLLCVALSLYLELPDRGTDLLSQKRTLVVRRGERLGFLLGLILTTGVIVYFLFLALIPLLSVPLNFWVITMFSMVPLVIAAWSLRRYYANPTKLAPIVFRNVTGIFLVFILLDVYFAYQILI